MGILNFLFGSKEYRHAQKMQHGDWYQKGDSIFIKAHSGTDSLELAGGQNHPAGGDSINHGGGLYEIRPRVEKSKTRQVPGPD